MIIIRLSGGMGNQMFQYALGRALSLKYNVPLKLNTEAYAYPMPRPFKSYTVWNYNLDLFNIKAEIAKREEIPWMFRMYGKGRLALVFDAFRRRILKHKGYEPRFSRFNEKILALGSNAYLDGFWQSPKYFASIAEIIRDDFTLKNSPAEKIKSLLAEIQGQNSVGVHVRRGDFLHYAHFFEETGQAYYNKGIEYINQQAKIDTIYVFSDDIAWCKQNMKFLFPTVFVGNEYAGKQAEGHLLLMSGCKYFITATSSFSWWAAWLSRAQDKIVITPRKWFKDPNLGIDDLIPPSWIKI